MRFPWQRERETRADSSYTDALISAITANAGGRSLAVPTATAALEACAGFVGRAFAAAEVTALPAIAPALDPLLMNMIGRALVRRGELVLVIQVDIERGLRLFPAETHTVAGGADPATWRYRCTVGGPARTLTFTDLPPDSVVHLTYAVDPERPWRGYGPLYSAQLAGRLSANTSAMLADEAGGPVGSIISLPVDGGDGTLAAFKADLATMKGKVHLLQGGDWDAGDSGGKVDPSPKRVGADPPAALVELHARATQEIYAAIGLNPSIFEIGTGTAGREAYRQALFGVIAPLGRMVETELRRKLADGSLVFGWDELRASDIAGRARAFQSLVGAGMALDRAAALSGLMAADAE